MDRGRIRTDNPGRSTVELRDRPPVTRETGLGTVTAPENEGTDVAGRLCVTAPSFLPTYGWGLVLRSEADDSPGTHEQLVMQLGAVRCNYAFRV